MNKLCAVALVTLAFGIIPLTDSCLAQNVNDPGKGSLYRPVPKQDPNLPDRSHSHFGAAFDQGPRQHAHLMTGVGNVHFPVTTTSSLAQRFFDQGINLLYGFSWYEAERSFREAAFQDPSCAMAYWGMAMCDNARGKEFLELAQKREGKATERERRYIAALAINFREGKGKARTSDNIKALEQITIAYPDDVDAKAMLAWALYRQQQNGEITYRAAIDALLRQVLAKNPMHPGAHHFRIHMWDGIGAENALDSCRAFSRAAPNVGHALHMPGHIYARLGMWDQAIASMDASARAERRYFYTDHQLPYESWDYGHDQDFLISCLGYAGRLQEGAALAWELIDIPHDPDYNTGLGLGASNQGRFGLMRMRIRGEKWDEILNDSDAVGWNAAGDEHAWRAYTFALAYLGKGDRAAADKHIEDITKNRPSGDTGECAVLELKGRYSILYGEPKAGLDFLKKAAEIEKAKFKYGDPIGYPRPLYETLAWAQIHEKLWSEAEATLKEGLERNPNNGFALCLKVQCLLGQGKQADAVECCRTLSAAWRHADPDIPAIKAVQSLMPGFALAAATPTSMRRPSHELLQFGPERWAPFPAPEISVRDQNGHTVKLSQYRGRNVLLVFTLGGSCPRCNKQLQAMMEQSKDFASLGTDILSISTDSSETINAYLAGNPNPGIRVLSDPAAEAARKFKAYDEFENLDLHATILIDRSGRVWWYRTGIEPFFDLAFLKQEIGRMDAWSEASVRHSGKHQSLPQKHVD